MRNLLNIQNWFIVIPLLVLLALLLSNAVKNPFATENADLLSISDPAAIEQTLLDVPIFIQEKRFACNLEAARMVLFYRGINKTTQELYDEIAKDPTPYDEKNNIFGDPNAGYVGDIFGRETGYGAHWKPISDLISKYRPNEIKTGWDLENLLIEITKGNPFLAWSQNDFADNGIKITWKTPDGRTIDAVQGMHTYVVVGFNGSVEDPSEIVLYDSIRGQWTVPKEKFLELWSVFNNTGIVVY